MNFVTKAATIFYGHWGGYWQYETYPQAECIVIDTKMHRAVVYFRFIYGGGYVVLEKQLRMQADPETMDWIDSFTKEGELKKIPVSSVGYSIRVFDSPELLDKEIRKRAGETDSALSRVIATYDWEYSSNNKPEARLMKYWEVLIGTWHKPWNRELESELSKKEKRAIKGLAWAE